MAVLIKDQYKSEGKKKQEWEEAREVRISKKKWKKLKKRVAGLEGQVQSQQREITDMSKRLLEMRLTKSGGTHHHHYENQSQ